MFPALKGTGYIRFGYGIYPVIPETYVSQIEKENDITKIFEMNSNRNADYSNCVLAKKGRRFGVILIDYFLTVIFSFLFFVAVVQPIYENIPYVTQNEEVYTQKTEELQNIIGETRLQEVSDTGRLVEIAESADEYALALVKTSYYVNGLEYYEYVDSKKTVIELTEEDTLINIENDNIRYYYTEFKYAESIGDYLVDNADYSDNRLEYFNTAILKLDSDNADLLVDSFNVAEDVFCLNSEDAQELFLYLEDDANDSTVYERVYDMYGEAVNTGVEEVETLYQIYIDTFAEFEEAFNIYAVGYDIELVIAYVLGFLVTNLLFPLCFGNGKTVGYRFFKLALLRNDNTRVRWTNMLVKDIVLFIIQFSTCLFPPVFLSSYGMLGNTFFLGISMLQLIIFSFLMAVISLVFFFISKDNQTLSEFASGTYTVNTEIHENGSIFMGDDVVEIEDSDEDSSKEKSGKKDKKWNKKKNRKQDQ